MSSVVNLVISFGPGNVERNESRKSKSGESVRSKRKERGGRRGKLNRGKRRKKGRKRKRRRKGKRMRKRGLEWRSKKRYPSSKNISYLKSSLTFSPPLSYFGSFVKRSRPRRGFSGSSPSCPKQTQA